MFERRSSTALLAMVLAAAFCPACGSGGDAALAETPPSNPSRNVTQGGPQDISEFRAVLDRGSVPDGKLLDEVGFFAEHAIDLPPAECGDALCVHPMLAVTPRFNGENWSMAFVGLNTAFDPSTLPRSPQHLIVVIEDSESVLSVLPSFQPVAASLSPALDALDRVSVILAGERSRLVAGELAPEELASVELEPRPASGFDLYLALSHAHDVAASAAGEYGTRVLLLTTGVVDSGIRQPEQFAALGESMAAAGIGLSTFGMGDDYRREIPMLLAELGSGNHYFVRDTDDLGDALAVEGETAFVPLAKELELRLEARPGYRIGRVYGARRAQVTEQSAVLSTKTLFLGAREGSGDVSSGRRGGGGGWFVELVAELPPGAGASEPADAFTLRTSFEDALSGAVVERVASVSTPFGIGQNPTADTSSFFSHAEHAKPFMMLNMYLALSAAVSLYEAGDCGRALGVQPMMAESYESWKAVYDDPDIDGDWRLLQQLSQVIDERCEAAVVEPVDLVAGCAWFAF